MNGWAGAWGEPFVVAAKAYAPNADLGIRSTSVYQYLQQRSARQAAQAEAAATGGDMSVYANDSDTATLEYSSSTSIMPLVYAGLALTGLGIGAYFIFRKKR